MKLETLQDLLVEELRDLYNAEKQITKALPKMAKAATAPKLKKAFEQHLEQTHGHVERLEQVFELLGLPAKGKKCKAMEGLIQEAKELLQEDAEPEVLDAGLIAAGQRVEHYEMAGYGCVRTYATILGHKKVARLLQQTLDEEGKADQKLTEIAQNSININAVESGDGRMAVSNGKKTSQKNSSSEAKSSPAKSSDTKMTKKASAGVRNGRNDALHSNGSARKNGQSSSQKEARPTNGTIQKKMKNEKSDGRAIKKVRKEDADTYEPLTTDMLEGIITSPTKADRSIIGLRTSKPVRSGANSGLTNSGTQQGEGSAMIDDEPGDDIGENPITNKEADLIGTVDKNIGIEDEEKD